jgi:hypothetical protein
MNLCDLCAFSVRNEVFQHHRDKLPAFLPISVYSIAHERKPCYLLKDRHGNPSFERVQEVLQCRQPGELSGPETIEEPGFRLSPEMTERDLEMVP